MQYNYKKSNWFHRQGYVVKAGLLTVVFFAITAGIEFLFDRSEFTQEIERTGWGLFLLKKLTAAFIWANVVIYLIRKAIVNKTN